MSIRPDEVHVLSSSESTDDARFDRQVRPTTLNEFIGQPKLKEQLEIWLDAARGKNRNLDHTLFYGPPGLGKTTLAHIVANEMGSPMRTSSGPVLERPGDIASILTNLEHTGTLFVDECHRLPPPVEELLYPAMEEFKFDILLGEGPSARSVRMDLSPFTLIGATTRVGLLTAPLYARFEIVLRLDYYEVEDLAEIVRRSARILSIPIDDDGALEIARRSRSTPRLANRLLRRARDYAEVKADGKVSAEVADKTLQLLEVDTKGLDGMDSKFLLTIMEKFSGGPVGIDTLSAAIGEDRGSLEEIIEPFLMQQGFLMRTPRGRVVTPLARAHFKQKGQLPENLQIGLNLDGIEET